VITLATAFRTVFADSFSGASWWPWRTVAKILSGEPLDDAELALALKCTGRTRLPARPPRRLYLLVGRRGAKSRFASACAVHAAIATDWRAVMAPGEQPVVLLLAVDRAQAQVCRRYCRGLIQASRLLAGEVVRETEDVVELRNGCAICIGTNDHRSVRGRTIAVLVGDETAYWKSDGEALSSDEEVVAAVEPAMATVPGGGLTVLISTAYRKKGLMHRRWKELFGNDDAADVCWVAPTTTMNPLLPTEVIDRALTEDPARARSEYLCEWREDLSDFVPTDAIESCTDWGVRERPRVPGVHYTAFTDAAGGTGADSFTLGISHRRPDGTVVLDVLRERAPRFVPAAVTAEFAGLLKAYAIHEVRGDHFSGSWCADEFARNGVRYTPSEMTKSEIYLATLPLLLAGRCRLLDNEKLRKQFAGLERRAHANGRESVDHGAGGKDDLATAAAGALLLAQSAPRALWTREAVLVDGRPAVTPSRCEVVFAVLVAGQREAAVVNFGRERPGSLMVLDCEAASLSPAMLDGVLTRLRELGETTRAQCSVLFATKPLVAEMSRRGCQAQVIDSILNEGVEALALAAAVHVGAGRVKITSEAMAKRHPLDACGGDDDPLYLAVLAGVAVGLDPGRTLRAAA
jgi:hypothetical protein